jgi:hypothetical protein
MDMFSFHVMAFGVVRVEKLGIDNDLSVSVGLSIAIINTASCAQNYKITS